MKNADNSKATVRNRRRMIQRVAILIGLILLFPSCTFDAQGHSCPESELGNEHGNLGAHYWESGHYQLAAEETKLAIKHDPDCSMWHQNLGFILDAMGRTDEAHKSFLKSLEIDKYWCTAFKTGSLLEVGYYYYKNRNYSKSIDSLKEAISTAERENVDEKNLSLIYTYLSYNYTDAKEDGNPYFDLEIAEKYKRKALAHNPEDLFIKTSLVKLMVLQGKRTEAKQNISEIIEQQENSKMPNPAVYAYLAHIYSLLEEPKQTAKFLQKAMDMNPQYAADYLLSELDKDFKNVANTEEMKAVIVRAKKIKQNSNSLN